MIKEIDLIDKDNIVEKLEGFAKSFCGDDVEKIQRFNRRCQLCNR